MAAGTWNPDTQRLTNVSNRFPIPPEVPLAYVPNFPGPWTYDLINQVALPAVLNATEQLQALPYVQGLVVSQQTTTTRTITIQDAFKLLATSGALATITYQLPVATPGISVTFYAGAATGTVTVLANGANTIQVANAISQLGGSIATSVLGSSLTLVAISATEWVSTSALGVWLVDGSQVNLARSVDNSASVNDLTLRFNRLVQFMAASGIDIPLGLLEA